MRAYNYSEFRQNLATILEQAKHDGSVRITRKNGDVFIIKQEVSKKSPFDIKGIDLNFLKDEIISFIKDSRKLNGR